MEHFSPAELAELRLLAVSVMDTQFQFWISITFAVVVATFAAGENLSRGLRYAAALLYGLATFVIVARFRDEGGTAAAYGAALRDLGIETVIRVGPPTLLARYSLFAIGTVAALIFLLWERKGGWRR
jgi:hypothetical protein